MRILHVIPGFAVSGGGGNRACAELCEGLGALGHDVEIAHAEGMDVDCFMPKNVRVRSFPTQLLNGFAYSARLRDYLSHAVPSADIVHIHATWQYPSIPAARYSRQHNVPYVVQPHGNLHPWKLRHKAARKRVYWHLVEKRILQHARFIHVESEADRKDVAAVIPDVRTITLPCGAKSAVFLDQRNSTYVKDRWPAFRGMRWLLYLARIDVNKGVDLLLKAFANVKKQFPDIRLLMVGPDYAGTTLRMQRLATELQLEDSVIWAGMVSEQERVWILQQCDIYVLPSLSENFAISVLEAMFCGKPVLTTTSTPWQELAQVKGGVIVEATQSGITDGLRSLLSMSEEQLRRMGREGKALALRKYDWAAIASSMVDAYSWAIENPERGAH